jgi:hypothetical protein
MSGEIFTSTGAVGFLVAISFAFYRYVWKPQQDRMDAFSSSSQHTLEERLDKAEARIANLEGEVEQCHRERRQEMEANARLTLALIRAGVQVPD